MINQILSHYKIIDKLGAGGMGEVYRAEDTNLDRQVAIKVLPDVFADDAERLARFEREAKLLASLNHPNIAAIHGLEESDGKRFLVLELVEGKTLAERIKKGPLPVDEALEVCRQIAEGLESAHEKGVIHRDLKPANVKITPEGKVKVLDFGLAKAFHEEPAAADLSHSPTITEGMTREGVILGTAAYMSPEQAQNSFNGWFKKHAVSLISHGKNQFVLAAEEACIHLIQFGAHCPEGLFDLRAVGSPWMSWAFRWLMLLRASGAGQPLRRGLRSSPVPAPFFGWSLIPIIRWRTACPRRLLPYSPTARRLTYSSFRTKDSRSSPGIQKGTSC